MAYPCSHGVLGCSLPDLLLSCPPQVDDLAHTGKLTHMAGKDEMGRMIKLTAAHHALPAHYARPEAASGAPALLARLL